MGNELKDFRDRWQIIAEIERREMQSASIDLRWQQLNAVIGMAIGLDILKPDESEIEVYQRWAKLKEKAVNQGPRSPHS